ncbi:MAG: hypothetical protein ACJAWL_001847 [Motiliproteus sp.]|jgi:hypothetical protein
MLTKILVTALVIIGCYLFIRSKRHHPVQRLRVIEAAPESAARLPSPVRLLALGLCVFSLLASAAFMGLNWLDNQTLLKVRVTSTLNGESADYRVYKGDLEGRSFITTFGQRVIIADNERMEISEVKEP